MAISDMSPALQRALAHKQRMAIAWRPYAKPVPTPVALAPHPAPASIPLAETRSSAVVLDDAALAEWADGLTTRVGLQAELTWVGLNDGYVDAGGNDVAIPYLGLYWILGPVIKQHCFQCPEIANGSPYDPPGKGGHTIDQSPGDGGTVCGAGCKCWLEYGLPLVSVPKNYAWSNNVFPGPGKATAEIGAQQLQRQAASYSWQETMLLNPESEYLSDAQKGALDLFRAKWFAWEDVRGTLPQAPDMFAGADAAQSLQDLDTFWETLTTQQSNILIDLQEAIGAWNDATAEANGLLDASLDDGADLGGDGGDDAEQLAEAGADEAIQLFSFGRAFGGAGAAGRGAHGVGSAFDSLHPRGFHGMFRFVNGGRHAGEGGQREHAGNAEHAGGQRGANKEERSPNAHANRRVLRGKVNDSARTSRLAQMAKRTGSVEKSPNEGAARRSGAVKAGGRAKSGEPRGTTAMHETSARWQSEHPNAPRELQPGEKLVASGQVAGHKFDPYAHLDPAYLAGVYGEHALGAALSRYSVGRLREAGTDLGLKNMGTSHAAVVSRITAHVTNGHYSANFPKESAKAPKEPKTARGTGKRTTKAEPAKELTPVRSVANRKYDPYAPIEPRYLRALYGDKQLHAALDRYSLVRLRESAKLMGVKAGAGKEGAINAIANHLSHETEAQSLARMERAGKLEQSIKGKSPEAQARLRQAINRLVWGAPKGAAKATNPQKTAEEKLVAQRATQLASAKSQNQAGYSEHLRATSSGGMAAYRMPKAEWFGPGGPHAMQVRAAQLNLANARTLAKGDTAWKGEEHPPFSKSEFLRATLKPMNSRQQGHNPGFTTKIGETTYHIKLVQRDTALASETAIRFIKGSENATYQAHAEQAATEIGHLLGVGEHMVDAHSFQVGNNHFVATKFQTGVKPLGDQEKGATPAKEAALFKTIGEGGAARLMLHEYLTGNGDAHAANVLTSAKTGEVKIIDFGRAFTQPGALMQGSHSPTRPVVNSWFRATAAKLGIKGVSQKLVTEAPQKGVYKAMHIPHEAVQHALGQESRVMGILHAHGLDAAVKSTQARFNVLRQLGNDTSLQHFDELQIKAFVAEGSQGRGAVDFSEAASDSDAIQLFSIGGALRGLLGGGGRGAGGGHGGMMSGGRSVRRKGNGEFDGSTKGEQKSKPASTRGHRGEGENAGHGGKGKPAKVEEKSPNEHAVRRAQARRPAIERTASGHVVEHVAQRVQERQAERARLAQNDHRVAKYTERVTQAKANLDRIGAQRDAMAAAHAPVHAHVQRLVDAWYANGEPGGLNRHGRINDREINKASDESERLYKLSRPVEKAYWKAHAEHESAIKARNEAIARLPEQQRPHNLVAAPRTRDMAKELPVLPQAARLPSVSKTGRIDEAGQRMPFTREEFARALIANRPLSGLDNDQSVYRLELAGKVYYAKHDYEFNDPRGTIQEAAQREVGAIHVARMLGMRAAVPAASYHIYQNDHHYSITRAVEGEPIYTMNEAHLASFMAKMSGPEGQKLLTLEYVTGQVDRHGGNVLYDAATGQARLIDFGYEFGQTRNLAWGRYLGGGITRNASAVAQAVVGMKPNYDVRHSQNPRANDQMKRAHIDRALLERTVARESHVVSAMRRVGMGEKDIAGVTARFGVLRALAAKPDPTLKDWNDLANAAEKQRIRETAGLLENGEEVWHP